MTRVIEGRLRLASRQGCEVAVLTSEPCTGNALPNVCVVEGLGYRAAATPPMRKSW
ncbi:MAG: hypothetical protein R3F11_26165 [Verrucomicrobiales bacterium]